jgi:hypothetical protein
LVTDINQVTPKLNTAITNLNNLASCIRNNYSPSGTTSGDGLLKRLTQFDDDFTTHISRKMPPVVDLKGQPHIGFHVNNTPVKHAHPEGWTATTGTCLTATVTANTWTGGNVTNVWFVPKSTSNWYPPTNQTWAGLISWYALPRAVIYATNGVVSSADFQLKGILGGGANNANCSFGYGWSVGDEMMSAAGSSNGGSTTAWFHATVTSVGTQLYPLPPDNATTGFIGRTPHDPLSTVHGDPSPGQGGPPEPADWGEGGSHNIMDESNQSDQDTYNSTVLNANTLKTYPLTQENIVSLSDPKKVKRAEQLVLTIKNRLRSWEG